MAFTVEDLINMLKEHDGSLPLIAFHRGKYVDLPELRLSLIHDQHERPYGVCVESEQSAYFHCDANFSQILKGIEGNVRRKYRV